jgi:hypothetical protein
MPVVRISRGSFEPQHYATVRRMLETSKETLIPAVRRLNGLLSYHAGIDAESNTMVNVSVWESLADAKQMESLAPMLALAKEFIAAGVRFERPIVNYETLWSA